MSPRTRAEIDLMREGYAECLERSWGASRFAAYPGHERKAVARTEAAAAFPYPKVPRVWTRSDGVKFRLNADRMWETLNSYEIWALYNLSPTDRAAPTALTEADARAIVDLYDHPWEEV